MTLFSDKSKAGKEWFGKKHPGQIPEISDHEFFVALTKDLAEWAVELRLERCLADRDRLDPPLDITIANAQADYDALQNELARVSGLENELFNLKAKREEMLASDDYEAADMDDVESKIKYIDDKLGRAVKLINACEASRRSLSALDKQLATLRRWQTREEILCGGTQFGGWQILHPSNKVGTPCQVARKLLVLAEHGLKQARDLQAGKMPRVAASKFGFSRKQISIPFLSFVLDE